MGNLNGVVSNKDQLLLIFFFRFGFPSSSSSKTYMRRFLSRGTQPKEDLRSMANPLTAASRLAAMTRRILNAGTVPPIRESRKYFFTTPTRTTIDHDVEPENRGSRSHPLYRFKISLIFILGAIGFVIYDELDPDKESHRQKLKNYWAHQAGGAYDPNKPQNSHLEDKKK